MKQDTSGMNFAGWTSAALLILATAMGCAQSELVPGCEEQTTWLDNPQYVSLRDCKLGWQGWEHDAKVVTIRRNRPNSELWVLEEPTATPASSTDAWLEGRELDDPEILDRSRALVQMNGYIFATEKCDDKPDPDWDAALEDPCSMVIESFQPISTASEYEEYPLSFGPRSTSGIPIHLGAAYADPLYSYNAVGSAYFLMRAGGECGSWDWDWKESSTAIGYGTDPDPPNEPIIVMAVASGGSLEEWCALLRYLGVTDAVMMDGGTTAGMYLNSPVQGVIPIGGQSRRIPYRIGLVTLGEELVWNGGFETPRLPLETSGPPTGNSGTPTGFHSFSGIPIVRWVHWNGAMFLYDANTYNRHARHHGEGTLPHRGYQVAALRPRDLDTNYISQALDVPANRYCMLHFYHGFHPASPGCSRTASQLTLSISGSSKGVESYVYSNSNTTNLDEEWLRFTTSSITDVTLKFEASDPEAEGPCEVLLDDVSVSCAQ